MDHQLYDVLHQMQFSVACNNFGLKTFSCSKYRPFHSEAHLLIYNAMVDTP